MIPDRERLKAELKELIISECQKEMTPDQFPDSATMIGGDSDLGFDSLDALQIALAVQRRYGKRIEGNNVTRHALTSINTLADFILT
jgi:acyl carrier protein